MEPLKADWHKPEIEIYRFSRVPFSHESWFEMVISGWRVPIVNIRYEQFKSVLERFQDNRVWVRIWTQIIYDEPMDAKHWGCVNDGRIPKECYAKSLCWLGNSNPPFTLALEICNHVEMPHEVEQFIFPETYWQARGGVYKNGQVTFPG